MIIWFLIMKTMMMMMVAATATAAAVLVSLEWLWEAIFCFWSAKKTEVREKKRAKNEANISNKIEDDYDATAAATAPAAIDDDNYLL